MTPPRLAVVIGCAWLLAGCSGSTPAPVPSSVATPVCATSDLVVTMSDGAVRAVNTSGHKCALSGTSAVSVLWWRVVSPIAVPPTGSLAPGSSLVQVYKPEVTNGCPGGAMNRDKTADLAVTVEGHGYAISMPADQVYQKSPPWHPESSLPRPLRAALE
jgi:hypothetical protein